MNNLPPIDANPSKPSPINSNTLFSAERIMRITSEEWRVARTKEMEWVNIMTGETIIQQLIDNARELTGNTVPWFQYSEKENVKNTELPKHSWVIILWNAIENYFWWKSPRSNKDKAIINIFLSQTPFEWILDMDYWPGIRLVWKRILVENFYDSMRGIQASYAFLAILTWIHKTAIAKEYIQWTDDINITRLDWIIKSISKQGEVSIGSVISTAAHYAQSGKATGWASVNHQRRINNSSSDTVTPHLPR